VSSLGNGVSGNVSGNGNEAVINALATGKTDSWIIQNVLGMKGRNYSRGKQELEAIKSSIELGE
ncbi:MAG: hypothetical protein ACRC8A_13360, partial [Microcoleaceae cyanobacterium]